MKVCSFLQVVYIFFSFFFIFFFFKICTCSGIYCTPKIVWGTHLRVNYLKAKRDLVHMITILLILYLCGFKLLFPQK